MQKKIYVRTNLSLINPVMPNESLKKKIILLHIASFINFHKKGKNVIYY